MEKMYIIHLFALQNHGFLFQKGRAMKEELFSEQSIKLVGMGRQNCKINTANGMELMEYLWRTHQRNND